MSSRRNSMHSFMSKILGEETKKKYEIPKPTYVIKPMVRDPFATGHGWATLSNGGHMRRNIQG